ncbi:MAG TPA: EAL domain-containing protein [Microlunatus sp.]|nr:EAL domain-containing protein [Microlunatus sp.]
MHPATATTSRLAGRLCGIAALSSGFPVGTVRLRLGDDATVRHSGRFPSDLLAAEAERLDAEVVTDGLPRTVEDLSMATGGGNGDPSAGRPNRPSGCYAGVPVHAKGRVVGVISVVDSSPRLVGRHQVRLLIELSRLLSDQLVHADGAPGGEGVDDAATEIAAALAAGELRPWYQPIVDLASDQVVGMEALARWHRPTGAVEVPAAFVPIAERSDLIVHIDRAILAQALHDLARWQRLRPEFRVSVNLSGRHLDDPAIVEILDDAVSAAGVSPTTVDLEITETARPTDLRAGAEVFARLADRGFTVWFDDFGSGWSALQDLIRLPVGGIKLDRSFAEHLGTPVDDAVISALAAAMDHVGLRLTLEGIETRQQADEALRLGCRFGQGHLWSRARPAAEVTSLIAS